MKRILILICAVMLGTSAMAAGGLCAPGPFDAPAAHAGKASKAKMPKAAKPHKARGHSKGKAPAHVAAQPPAP